MPNDYEQLKALARQKRTEHSVETTTLNLSKMRAIYKREGIVIDLWSLPASIRAVYMCEDGDPGVLVNKNLPKEPRLFSMAHELKHHLKDRALIEGGKIKCGDYNANQHIEVGAEIFAAEFIFPEAEFLLLVQKLGFEVRSPRRISSDLSGTVVLS
jgi:Zn-dependent peptidase ImmA (M78 family)